MTWGSIPGYEGRYAVSDSGEVMSMNFAKSGLPGVLKPSPSRGYLSVELERGKRFTIHRLVADVFIGPRPSGMQINHRNGIKTDNRVENLEYVTGSENMKHAFSTGLQSNVGERHSQAKLTEEKIIKVREMLGMGFKQTEIAILMGITQSAVSLIKNGKRWNHMVMAKGELL